MSAGDALQIKGLKENEDNTVDPVTHSSHDVPIKTEDTTSKSLSQSDIQQHPEQPAQYNLIAQDSNQPHVLSQQALLKRTIEMTPQTALKRVKTADL